jgi:hypothetical protein
MKNYRVTVTGTWDIDIEANTAEQAESLAYFESLKEGIDVEGMNLEFEVLEGEDNGI